MKKCTHSVLLTFIVTLFAQSGFAQLFPNGDFELGPAATICQCPTNFTCGNDAGRVVNGVHPVFVAGTSGGCIGPTNYYPQLGALSGDACTYFYAGADNFDAQPANFVGGEEVCLTIWYCGPQGWGASGQNTSNSHFSFKVDGAQVGPDVQVPTDTPWTEHTFTVIMTAGAHTFGVLSGGAAQYSIWFDDFNADICGTIPACDPAWTATTACSTDPPINLDALITGDAGGVWSGTGVTGNMFDPSSGTQSITYTNAAPCTDFSTQNITVTTSADAGWTPPAAICEVDGVIDLTVLITGTAGGTWSGTGVTGTNFDPSGLAGPIAITYAVGTPPCDAASIQNITVVTNPDPTWTPPINLCSSSPLVDLNTSITGTAGGTWSGTGVTGNNFDPASGTQSITYTVGSGSCQQILAQNITVGTGGDPSWTTTALCTSDAPINLDPLITGDPGGIWSGTSVTVNIFDPFNGTQSVTYTVGVGACAQTSTQDITVVEPQLIIVPTNIACFGSTDGSANVTVTGGSGNYTYSWDSTPAQGTQNATNLGAGNYTVTVTDNIAGCIVSETTTIIEPSEITGTLTAANGCGTGSGIASISAAGGVGGFTYVWNNSPSTLESAINLDSAMHTVIVTDGNGCTFTDSILVETFPSPIVTTITDTVLAYGTCLPIPAYGANTYNWAPNYELDCDDCQTPIGCPEIETIYCVTGTDLNGCSDTACVKVSIEIICGEVFVPTGFSPNGDGENELECVYSDCLEQFTFSIFNRWGEKVFETSEKSICWDGIWKGKELNSAVFVYVLDGRLINGESVSKKGNITLTR
jgi:gliding motility-associated-like protein